MKALALSVLLVCAGAGAAEPRRGWLTGAGLFLAGGGAVALSLAAYQGGQADAAARTVLAYYSHGAAPTAAEAPRVRWLQERADGSANQALTFLISGGAALVLGVGLVLFDGWVGRATMELAIQPSGASVLVRGRF